MRKAITLLLALLLAATAAACGDDEEGATTTAAEEVTTTAAAEETTTTAASGGTVLTVGERAFTMADLEALGVVNPTLEHPSHGPTAYTGVGLFAVLSQAGVPADATTVTFIASDGYEYQISLTDVMACTTCLVAFLDDGTLGTAMPGLEGKAWVKDLVEIAVS